MNNFFSEINDQLNPILVKETRQTLTRIGYYVVGALVLLLIMALGAISEKVSGATAFNFVTTGDILIVIFITVVHAGRINQERRGNNELMFNTPMTPFKIVLGKYMSILCFAIFTIALSLPFATACYFMNGVSLLDVMIFIIKIIIYAMLFSASALFICSTPRRKIADAIPLAFISIFAVTLTVGIIENMSYVFRDIFQAENIITLIGMIAYITIGFALTMDNLSAPTKNRFAITKIIVLIMLAGVYITPYNNDSINWVIVAMGIFVMPCICIISPVKISHRMLNERPHNVFGRIIKFIFLNNAYPTAILAIAAMILSSIIATEERFMYGIIFPIIYITLALHIKAFMCRNGREVNGGIILIVFALADVLIRFMLVIFAEGSTLEKIFNNPEKMITEAAVCTICIAAVLSLIPGVIVKAKEYCLTENKTE